MQLECVGVRVADLDRSIRFYTGALGLRIVRRDDCREWGGGMTALLRDPRSHQMLELNWYPRTSMFAAPYRRGDELDHLDVSLGSVSRGVLERAYAKLLRCGGKPTRFSPSSTGGWAGMVRDPDGIWIRLGRSPLASERRSRAGV